MMKRIAGPRGAGSGQTEIAERVHTYAGLARHVADMSRWRGISREEKRDIAYCELLIAAWEDESSRPAAFGGYLRTRVIRRLIEEAKHIRRCGVLVATEDDDATAVDDSLPADERMIAIEDLAEFRMNQPKIDERTAARRSVVNRNARERRRAMSPERLAKQRALDAAHARASRERRKAAKEAAERNGHARN